MSNKFTLTRRTDNTRASLLEVDAEMCAHFGVPEGPNWHHEWVQDVTSALANSFSLRDQLGREQERLERLRVCQRKGRSADWQPYPGDEFQQSISDAAHTVAVLAWLDEHFVARCWSPV